MGVQVIINNNNKNDTTVYFGSRVWHIDISSVDTRVWNVSKCIGRYQRAKAQWFWCKRKRCCIEKSIKCMI